MFSFLKSQSFWLTFAHVAVAAAGAYVSYTHGTPLPSVVSGGLNALLPSPVTAPTVAAVTQEKN